MTRSNRSMWSGRQFCIFASRQPTRCITTSKASGCSMRCRIAGNIWAGVRSMSRPAAVVWRRSRSVMKTPARKADSPGSGRPFLSHSTAVRRAARVAQMQAPLAGIAYFSNTCTSLRGFPSAVVPLLVIVRVFPSADRTRLFVAVTLPPFLNVLSPV